MKPPVFEKELERVEALHRLGVLDSGPDPLFDAVTKEASEKLHVPISTVSIVDKDREWYKSCQGMTAKEGPREIAFCSWALLSKDVFIVEDTLQDERFKNNPYVVGEPHIRFYAGIAILDAVSGLPVGVFCVKDTKPRKLSMEETGVLFDLAQRTERLINAGV